MEHGTTNQRYILEIICWSPGLLTCRACRAHTPRKSLWQSAESSSPLRPGTVPFGISKVSIVRDGCDWRDNSCRSNPVWNRNRNRSVLHPFDPASANRSWSLAIRFSCKTILMLDRSRLQWMVAICGDGGTDGFTGVGVVVMTLKSSKDGHQSAWWWIDDDMPGCYHAHELLSERLRDPKEGQSLQGIRVTNKCNICAAEMPLNKLMSDVLRAPQSTLQENKLGRVNLPVHDPFWEDTRFLHAISFGINWLGAIIIYDHPYMY